MHKSTSSQYVFHTNTSVLKITNMHQLTPLQEKKRMYNILVFAVEKQYILHILCGYGY